MKLWKITHKNSTNEPIKFVCKTNIGSTGIILNPNQFCLVEAQTTSFIEAQERRGFIEVDRNFDNSKLQLKTGQVYSVEKIKVTENKKDKTKLEEATENAEKYISNQ
jgi:hypothetical protein